MKNPFLYFSECLTFELKFKVTGRLISVQMILNSIDHAEFVGIGFVELVFTVSPHKESLFGSIGVLQPPVVAIWAHFETFEQLAFRGIIPLQAQRGKLRRLMSLTEEAIQQEKDRGVTALERKQAIKRLRNFNQNGKQFEVNEDMVLLYTAVKRIRSRESGGDIRVSPLMLRDWTAKASQSTMLKQAYFIAPKFNNMHFETDDRIKFALLDPLTFDELPAWFDASEFYLIDQVVPRELLGLGVSSLELKLGIQRTKALNRSGAASSIQDAKASIKEDGGHEPSCKCEDAGTVPTTTLETERKHSQERALVTKRRGLLREPSEPEQPGDAVEKICMNLKEEMDKENFFCADRNIPSAYKWFNVLKEHVLEIWGVFSASGSSDASAFVEGLDPVIKRAFKFSVLQLLSTRSFDVLPVFGKDLAVLHSTFPKLLPSLCLAVMSLAEYDITSAGEPKLKGLSLKEVEFFLKSNLQAHFVERRVEALLHKYMQERTLSDKERLPYVKQLREGGLKDIQKVHVDFAEIILGDIPRVEKVRFLLRDQNRYDLLLLWQGEKCKLLLTKPFALKKNTFASLRADDFWYATLSVSGTQECVEAISNPIAKDLVSIFRKLLEVPHQGGTVTVTQEAELFPFVKTLYFELAEHRLGVVRPSSELSILKSDVDNPELRESAFKHFYKVLSSMARSAMKTLDGQAFEMLKAHFEKHGEAPAQKLEPAKLSQDAAPEVHTETEVNGPAPQEKKVPAAGTTGEPTSQDLPTGTHVIVKSGIKKYDGQKGVIAKILSTQYRIAFDKPIAPSLDGEEGKREHTFKKVQVEAVPQIVTPAGKSVLPPKAETPEEAAERKKAKVEAIFGKDDSFDLEEEAAF